MANSNPRSKLSLYANLLNPNAGSSAGVISSEPVIYKQQEPEDKPKKQIDLGALRFAPPKRPQIATQKQKLKAKPLPKAFPPVQSSSSPDKAGPQVQTSTLADWVQTNDDVEFFAGENKQYKRGGRKKRKKVQEEFQEALNWDDIYDPRRPNAYADFKNSDEYYISKREFKDSLYPPRPRQKSLGATSDEESGSERPMNRGFAPSHFAPPPIKSHTIDRSRTASPVKGADYESGESAYQQRVRLAREAENRDRALSSRRESPQPQPRLAQAFVSAGAPPAPPLAFVSAAGNPPPPGIAPPAPKVHPSAVISAAPVRYAMPAPSDDLPATEEELQQVLQEHALAQEQEEEEEAQARRSNRPGQKGFAKRLMEKYGWKKGTGLGAQGTGITTALRVQLEKRKKKSDAEGGGYVNRAGMGKIVGGAKKKVPGEKEEPSMSTVVICHGMLDGLDLDYEMGPDGDLVQEIGEECGKKYGHLQRVYVDRQAEVQSVPVYLKFTSPLSALRAVSSLDGRIFNGNNVKAEFFDEDQFATVIA
ncbi:hypothetical protein EJ06DRAFT_557681 [Trichodelitschia bisporula]|uniref:G-patch domain-containing protein n=1 Tax=Trichodelitschia bisporula TaxID=703511 RepID=A0A6G1HTZ6_9PEZI|nr:hypothetical protein EJ06DRAFT_557681 [Trichodelitschia bisporula]